MNKTEWAVRYKENAPQETVDRIIALLADIGLETEYKDIAKDAKSCYSSTVCLKNTGLNKISSNGKGTTEAFSRASAYAELMERIENRMFFAAPYYRSSYYDCFKDTNPVYTARGDYQPDCMKDLKARIAATAKPNPFLGKTAEDVVDDLLEKLYPGNEQGFATVPFWAVKEQQEVYLPEHLLKLFVGSNGMASGNTLEEAIVQAASEIFERYVQLQMIDAQIVPPDIPRAELARYPIVGEIIDEIESRGQYRVYIKDCSLGKGLPVVCGAIIDTHQQTLGVKFGAHPDMGVALERVFSEAMQGKPLELFARINTPDFTPPSADARMRRQNSFNMLKVGMGTVPAWMLYDTPSYAFTPWQDVEGMDNHTLMQSMLAQLGSLCSDVYIRDASYLGFPSVWIYVPELSEMNSADTTQLKINRMQMTCQEIFRHLDTATDKEVEKLLRYAILQQAAIMENTINVMTGSVFSDKMPFADRWAESAFLAAVCHYRLGNLTEAAKLVMHVSHPQGYDHAAVLYLKARAQGATHEETAQLLEKLCQPQIAQKVLDDFYDPAKVLEKVYPVCPNMQCDTCSVAICDHKALEDFYLKLAALEEANSVGTADLARILR